MHVKINMESILCHDSLNIIYSFLDKKSLMNYDTANTNKKNREIMLHNFKNYYKYQISTCIWTIKRDIKFTSQICKVKYIYSISTICKHLILHSTGGINIINHNIETLYIDMHLNKNNISNILCKNLKKITIVYAINLCLDIFTSLESKCPKLVKILLIKCNINTDINGLNNNIKIKII